MLLAEYQIQAVHESTEDQGIMLATLVSVAEAGWFKSYLVENPRRHISAWCSSTDHYIITKLPASLFVSEIGGAVAAYQVMTWLTCWTIHWAAAWQNQQNNLCGQWRLRVAWASAHFDQNRRCPHEEAYHKAHSESSDQTGWMPRLIRVFAGHTDHFVVRQLHLQILVHLVSI